MPIVDVEGQKFEFPEGTSDAVIGNAIRQHFSGQSQNSAPATQTAPQDVPRETQAAETRVDNKIPDPSFIPGFDEPLMAIASGIPAEIAAGIRGLVSAPFSGAAGATEGIKETREAMSFSPRHETGQASIRTLGDLMKSGIDIVNIPISGLAGLTELLAGQGLDQAADTVRSVQDVGLGKAAGSRIFEETGSPVAAAAAETLPMAVMELTALKGLQKIRKGTMLIDDAGTPTKALRKALDEKGVSFESLTPQARKAIPKRADPKLIPGGDATKQPVKSALEQQIKSGARDDSLAKLKISDGAVVADKVGTEAVRQGFREGVVQSVKTASAGSKTKMKKMLSIMKRVKKSERAGLDIRPSDVVGDSVMQRFNFIRDRASKARKRLDSIAGKKLKGVKIDARSVFDSFGKKMDDLGIRLIEKKPGVIKPAFKGSDIAKNPSAQKAVKDAYDLLTESGPIDALKAHKLKKQLDEIIDFGSTTRNPLTKTGKKILKDLRRDLNKSIRDVNPDYAATNDILSESLTALDSLDDAVGTIDLFSEGASRAVGTKMRALLSNQQGRIKLENAMTTLNDSAAKLGATFGDDIKDLVMFADALDDKFGTVAKTSFSGQVEQGIRQVQGQGVKATLADKAAGAVGRGIEKARGINDFNAFESMAELLK